MEVAGPKGSATLLLVSDGITGLVRGNSMTQQLNSDLGRPTVAMMERDLNPSTPQPSTPRPDQLKIRKVVPLKAVL